jgi:two-component system OmpR family response regulator
MKTMDTSNKILIVDDDRDIRSLLAEYLDQNGYSAVMAADGTAMWAALQEHQFELIVLDLNLPGDDGLTLCRNLRSKSTIPVIMLTARGEPLDRILGLEMGADDYLPKPFEPRELLARIRKC